MPNGDVREWDRRAVLGSLPPSVDLDAETLRLPTPCAGWDLAALLRHMIAQHRGFAAAARGNGADPMVWELRPLGSDARADYQAAADDVVAAFAEPGALERQLSLPELSPTVQFAGATAIGFHLLDYVAHGWDVARTVGVDYAMDDVVLAATWQVASQIPGTASSAESGTPFGVPATVTATAPLIDRIVGRLGRSPDWTVTTA
ncbi:MAG: TIGR03086 family metal-binding protein [Jatrophihabitans sp.]